MLLGVIPIIVVLIMAGLVALNSFPNTGKLIIATAIFLLLCLSSSFGNNLLVDPLERQHKFLPSLPEDVSHVVVLSGGRGARVIEGVRLWNTRPDKRFVTTTRFQQDSVHKPRSMSGYYARTLGVSADKLEILKGALDTRDEITELKALVGDSKVVIVSSSVHLPRVRKLTELLQVNAIVAPSGRMHSRASWWRISVWFLLNSNAALHEYLGMIWLRLTAI